MYTCIYMGGGGRGHGRSRPKCNQPVWSEKREGGGGETGLAARRRPGGGSGRAGGGRGEGRETACRLTSTSPRQLPLSSGRANQLITQTVYVCPKAARLKWPFGACSQTRNFSVALF